MTGLDVVKCSVLRGDRAGLDPPSHDAVRCSSGSNASDPNRLGSAMPPRLERGVGTLPTVRGVLPAWRNGSQKAQRPTDPRPADEASDSGGDFRYSSILPGVTPRSQGTLAAMRARAIHRGARTRSGEAFDPTAGQLGSTRASTATSTARTTCPPPRRAVSHTWIGCGNARFPGRLPRLRHSLRRSPCAVVEPPTILCTRGSLREPPSLGSREQVRAKPVGSSRRCR